MSYTRDDYHYYHDSEEYAADYRESPYHLHVEVETQEFSVRVGL